jgi:hypothetical protein
VRDRSSRVGVAALWLTSRGPSAMTMIVVGALALCASSAIHFYLWNVAYRNVRTIGPLFLFQGSMAGLAAVLDLSIRKVAFLLFSALFLVLTIGGFVIATTAGLFGFTLHTTTGWAVGSLISEGCGTVAFGLAAALTLRPFRIHSA